MNRLFLLAGQSNMVGAGVTAEIPAALREPPPNVRLFEEGQWRELLWRERFGPEVGFAGEISSAFPEDGIVLCKVARGGANLHYDWNPDGVSQGPEDGYRGPMYPKLVEALRTVAAQLDSQEQPWECSALLWMQGERDAVFEHMANAYEANLGAFIASVRKDTRTPELPVILGQVSPRKYDLEKGGFQHAFRKTVQEAQRSLASGDPLVELVETLDLPQSDNLHYNTGGQLVLGRRFARAYLRDLSAIRGE
jgi:Carbohydrate esterase, sialic acid-specific acetylesterase